VREETETEKENMAIKINHQTDTISGSSAKILRFKTTQGIQMPSGKTLERPTGEAGTIRYNEDISLLEFFADGKWQAINPSAAAKVSIHRYEFPSGLRWVVRHNMGTTRFRETLMTNTGDRFYAKVSIIDDNSFQIDMTQEVTGYVDVIFDDMNQVVVNAN
jgi:hypothetical protein